MGNKKIKIVSQKRNIIYLIVSILLYYGIGYLTVKNTFVNKIQIISLLPLSGICLYFYKVCHIDGLIKLYNTRYIGTIMKLISMLTLEIYIIQGMFITNTLNAVFPLNIVLIFCLITLIAYFVNVGGKIFTQIFKEDSFNWKKIIKIV
jgi:hypothetical protein